MPFHLTGGVLAGAVAAIATSPIDAIKTRMQASTHPRLALLGARPVTLLPCCLQVYGRGAGIAATAAAMLRGHGTAAFTRLTPPPPTATGLVATRVGRSPLRSTRPSVSRLDDISGINLLKLFAPHVVSPAAVSTR